MISKKELELTNYAFGVILKDESIHTLTAFFGPLKDVRQRARITRFKNGNGFHLDIGRPNYSEREFLKLCKKAKTRPKKLWIKRLPEKH